MATKRGWGTKKRAFAASLMNIQEVMPISFINMLSFYIKMDKTTWIPSSFEDSHSVLTSSPKKGNSVLLLQKKIITMLTDYIGVDS